MSPDDEQLLKEVLGVDEDTPLYRRVLPGGDEITVWPMTFGKARVCIGPAGELWFEDAWCYESRRVAVEAARAWNGEGDPPDGWHRNPSTGRRREGGDPAKEYVRW